MEEPVSLEDRAARIVLAVHQSMDWQIWGSKRLKYWQILTDQVRSAAYTNSLAKFVNTLCSKMEIRALGKNKWARAEVERLLNDLDRSQERQLLRLFREEATTTVLQVRVWIEERRAELEALYASDDERPEGTNETEGASETKEIENGLLI